MLRIETAKVFEPLLQPCTATKECSRGAPRRTSAVMVPWHTARGEVRAGRS